MKNITFINLTKFTLYNIVKINKILYNLNMSVRKIKKSYISCTGYFASFKNKTQIAFESTLERDFYTILEFDCNVIRYEEQPIQINYEYTDGNNRRYTPDTLVTYVDGTQILFEVKYANELENNLELQQKIQILQKHIKEKYNLDFQVFTDKNIGKQYLDNLKFLYKFAFIPESKEKTAAIKKILYDRESIEIKEVLMNLHDNQNIQLEYLPYIWNYVFQNIKIVDLNQRLTMKTIIHTKRYSNG